MSDKRVPTQKRSIEKRNKIIEKGFKLICEKGYYNVTTADIAKYAEVSTGIVYQYFDDKKDIFLEGIKNYSDSIMYPMIDVLNETKIDLKDIDILLKKLIDKFVEKHTMSKKSHEELIAMSHIDEDVFNLLKTSEMEMANKLEFALKSNGINLENMKEKVHIIYGLTENFCHEIVYHKHPSIDYDVMQKEVIDIIKYILSK